MTPNPSRPQPARDAPTTDHIALLSIGQLSAAADVPITTLRYYEKRGLLSPTARVGGQRRYQPGVIMRLMVIRFCQVAGLTLDEILVVLNDQSPDRTVTKDLAGNRIVAINHQIAQLEMAKLMLASAVRCHCPSVETCNCGAMDEATVQLRSSLG